MSNPIKLYGVPLSQNVRKVLALTSQLGVELAHEPSMPQAPEVRAVNPTGRIPVIDDNGFQLGESNAILRYIARKEKSDMYPADMQASAEVDAWLAWDNAHWTPAYQPIQFEKLVKQMLGRGEPDQARIDQSLEAFQVEATTLNNALEGRDWLVGEGPTIADFAIGAGLTYAQPIGLPLEKFGNIRAWNERLGELEGWKKTAPQM
jgi:glutathione S-transferase